MVQVQCHFVRDRINHRLRFGTPFEFIKLDAQRKIALFKPGSIFGYIRWKANQYGTVDWRLYVLKVARQGQLSCVPGVTPAVNVLVSVSGKEAMNRALPVIDHLENTAISGLENVPESYWLTVSNALLLRQSPRELPRNHRKISDNSEANYAL